MSTRTTADRIISAAWLVIATGAVSQALLVIARSF